MRSLAVPAALATSVLLASCGSGESEEIATSDVVPVTVASARRGTIEAVVAATGVVAPEPGAELDVVAPEPARIAEIPKGVGDRVRSGDLLVRFEIPSLGAAVAARESDLARAQARRTNAAAALTRIQGLYERGIAARKEMEDAQKDMIEAEAAVGESEGAVAAARALRDRCVVRARFGGIVADRRGDPGDLVDPSAAAPILRVIDPARLEVQARVPVDELHGVEAGAAARVTGPPSYPVASARVLGHPAAVDPATSAATVRLALDGVTSLPAGTPVAVEIVTARHEGALVVPSASIVREGGSVAVFTVGPGGKARRRAVTVGIEGPNDTEILSGIDAGDRVIVAGPSALPDGAAVSIRE